MKVKTAIQMEYDEFDKIVNAILKLPNDKYGSPCYEYLANEEVMNDTVKEYNGIDGNLTDYDIKDLAKFKDTLSKEPFWMARILLNYLCNIGTILKGDYSIKIAY